MPQIRLNQSISDGCIGQSDTRCSQQGPGDGRKMLFLTNELAKKKIITILSEREKTWPWLQVGASWVKRKRYRTVSVSRESHLGL